MLTSNLPAVASGCVALVLLGATPRADAQLPTVGTAKPASRLTKESQAVSPARTNSVSGAPEICAIPARSHASWNSPRCLAMAVSLPSMLLLRATVVMVLAGLLHPVLLAQSIGVTPTQSDIVVAPGFNHAPLQLSLNYGSNSASDLGRLGVTSDSPWVSATIDIAKRAVVLAFTTATLTNRSYTATLTISDGSASTQVFVRATVAPLSITALIDDPVRSRVYGIQQDGAEVGSIVALDPITLGPIHNRTVGKRPTDFAISADGHEMLVINAADRAISVLDLRTFELRETIPLSGYAEWSGPAETSGHVKYGAGDIVYLIDGSWGPVLHTFNRSTRTLLQSVFFNGTAFTGEGNTTDGFGDIVLSPDRVTAYGWSQYGWSAGSGGASGGRFTITANGTVTPAGTAQVPVLMSRDPLNTPALISADGTIVVLKQYAFNTSSFTSPVRTFPSAVFAMSPGAEIVCTNTAIFEYATGNKLYELPSPSTVQVVTSDYARLVYFDASDKSLKSVNLFERIGGPVLRRESTPAHDAIVLPPTSLRWAPLAGVSQYRVYLGESADAIRQASPTTPEFLASPTTNSVTLSSALSAGRTYFWRVDVVTDNEVVIGEVQRFTVSTIAANTSRIENATVVGHATLTVPVELTSAAPGKTWSASSDKPWVKFEAATGSTPATVRVVLDASALSPGIAQATVSIAGPEGTFTIPVELQVDPLALTVIRSDPRSALVYAISEVLPTGSGNPPVSGAPHAYLLEIDSAAQRIRRVATVDTSATDLAIHHGDNRIYVPNWRGGSLLALNRDSLVRERSYAFKPYGQMGYSDGDVYRVAAGGPGRVVVEEQDQWINIALYDTTNGAILSKAFVREGGGQFTPDERFYIHGDNNNSGAELRKFDTVGDTLAEVARNRGNIASYYGSRTVVISEDGSRVFWAGSVFSTTDLAEQWPLGDIVYATSRDGRYAFAETKIYDVTERKPIFGMPTASKVSAFNTTTGKLVVQQDQRLGFYSLNTGAALATPTLALDTRTSTTLRLTWMTDGLQNGFTLQTRPAGAATWSDLPAPLPSTDSAYTAANLQPETTYEFRIKADGITASSAWSNIVTGTTTPAPPNIPSFLGAAGMSPTSVLLSWNIFGPAESITIERATVTSGPTTWTTLATVPLPATTYTDSGLTTGTTYSYRLKATRAGIDSGYTFISSATLQPASMPAITYSPSSQTVLAGNTVTFTTAASGHPVPSFQWYHNGVAIPGATNSTLTLTGTTSLNAGTYQVAATNSAGTVKGPEFTLTVAPSTSRMINFSVLANVGGDAELIVGFTIAGGPKNVLVRGLGPTLSAVGVTGVLPDPQLTLYRHTGATPVALLGNNDWNLAPNKIALLNATSRLTALPYVSDPSRDAAALVSLNVDGGYSVRISGMDQGQGLALVEIYDADTGTVSRLANISALTPVSPGNVLTAGFVITGSTRQTVLIRGVGPGLQKLGVPDTLPDPQLTLYRQTTTPIPIATNNDWAVAANKADILAASAITVGLALDDPSTDAVILVSLDPGAYTVQVASADGAAGIALVEVYDVP